MYSADPFMEHARDYLQSKVKQEAIDEVREVRRFDEAIWVANEALERKLFREVMTASQPTQEALEAWRAAGEPSRRMMEALRAAGEPSRQMMEALRAARQLAPEIDQLSAIGRQINDALAALGPLALPDYSALRSAYGDFEAMRSAMPSLDYSALRAASRLSYDLHAMSRAAQLLEESTASEDDEADDETEGTEEQSEEPPDGE